MKKRIMVALVCAIVGALLSYVISSMQRRAAIAQLIQTTEVDRARMDSISAALADSLSAVRTHSDTVLVAAHSATRSYDSLRAAIDTVEVPASVPPGSVVVPIAFVRAADSLAAVVPRLEHSLLQERSVSSLRIAAGDSSIALLRTEAAQLRLAAELGKPGIGGKLRAAGIGALMGAVLVEAIQHR